MRLQLHPTGFKKITLFSAFGYKVRIHYWPNGRLGAKPDIHDHRWNFLSIPIRGSFIDTRYRSLEEGEYILKQCFTEPKVGVRPVKTVGKGGVVEIARFIRHAGIPYICRAGEIHSYMPETDRAALSFVVTGRPIRDFAKVWHEDK